MEPAGIPRHYFIFINFTIFLILEWLLFFFFNKNSYVKLFFLFGIFSILIFSFFSSGNLKHKLNYNKFVNDHKIIYFDKIKDEKMLIFMNKFYQLKNNNLDTLKYNILELDKNFIGCKNNLLKRPCIKDLRKKDIILN